MSDSSDSLKKTNEEFESLKKMLAVARGHFEESDYEQAQSAFFQALKVAEELKMLSEKCECLEGLGASYYETKKYIESRAVYMQLVSALPDNIDKSDRTRVLLKLARSTDRLDDFDAAYEVYDDAFSTAENCMEPGDALLTEVYEAYSDFLRRARRDPDKLGELEKKVRVSRQRAAGVTQSPLDRMTENDTEDEALDEDFPDNLLGKFQRLSRKKPKLAILVLFSPVILAGVLLVSVVVLSIFGIDPGAKTQIKDPQQLSTLNKKLTMVITAEQATVKEGATTKTFNTRVLTRWSQLFSMAREQSFHQYWLAPSSFGYRGEDGLYLFNDDSPILQYQEAMKALAEVMLKYRDSQGKLPVSPRNLRSAHLELPEYPDFVFRLRTIQKTRRSAKLKPSELLADLQTGASPEWSGIISSKRLSGAAPITIVCLVPKHSSDFFFVAALDATHAPLRVSISSNPEIYYWIKGSAPRFVTDTGSKLDNSAVDTIAISDKDKESVQSRYKHAGIAVLIFLVCILPGGAFAIKPLKDRTVHWKYRSQQKGTYAEGMILSAYMLVCIFYLAYLAWIVLT